MKKLFLFLAIFMIGFAAAEQMICVDFDAPSAPSNLALSGVENSVSLSWDAATDTPECSGISYYEIYRSTDGTNFNLIAQTENTESEDTGLEYGDYTYIIHAWDLAGHNEGTGVSATITLSESGAGGNNGGGNNGGGGGGGPSTGIAEDAEWECGEWGECLNGTQERICEDILGNEANRTETRGCSPDFLASEGGNNIFNSGNNGQTQSTNLLTGAVTGITDFAKTGKGKLVLGFAALIVVMAAAVVIVNKRKNRQA